MILQNAVDGLCHVCRVCEGRLRHAGEGCGRTISDEEDILVSFGMEESVDHSPPLLIDFESIDTAEKRIGPHPCCPDDCLRWQGGGMQNKRSFLLFQYATGAVESDTESKESLRHLPGKRDGKCRENTGHGLHKIDGNGRTRGMPMTLSDLLCVHCQFSRKFYPRGSSADDDNVRCGVGGKNVMEMTPQAYGFRNGFHTEGALLHTRDAEERRCASQGKDEEIIMVDAAGGSCASLCWKIDTDNRVLEDLDWAMPKDCCVRNTGLAGVPPCDHAVESSGVLEVCLLTDEANVGSVCGKKPGKAERRCHPTEPSSNNEYFRVHFPLYCTKFLRKTTLDRQRLLQYIYILFLSPAPMIPRFSAKKLRIASVALSLVFLSGVGGILFSIPLGKASHTDCTDLIDNDADAHVDYPQDPGCTSAEDESEAGDISLVTVTVTDGHTEVIPGAPVSYAITLTQDRAPFVGIPVQFALPAGVDFLSASENGAFRDGVISWDDVTVFQRQVRRLTVFGTLRHDLPEGFNLVARATSGGASSIDLTHVRDVIEPGETGRFSLVLNDGLRAVKPGEIVRYRLEVRRGHYRGEMADVVFQLPSFTTFVGASRGASAERSTVTWSRIPFAPWQSRVFAVTIRVNRTVPEGYTLRARAHVGPVRVHDETIAILRAPGVSPVVPHIQSSPIAFGGPLIAAHAGFPFHQAEENVVPHSVFQVRTDTAEVVPGGVLRLSAFLRNPFPHTLSGLSVSARLSPAGSQVLRLSAGGTEVRSGRILWKIPDIDSGGSWNGRVAIRLPETLPQSADFRAVLSLEGAEVVRSLPLTERVASVHSTLLATLPKTGVSFDIFLTIGGWISSLVPFLLHRRLMA